MTVEFGLLLLESAQKYLILILSRFYQLLQR
jgi:hypothetical protein